VIGSAIVFVGIIAMVVNVIVQSRRRPTAQPA
jgi:hypothetical protein